MRILLKVGEGVSEFKNLTSESQDGRRLRGVVVTLEESAEPKLDDIAGKKSVENAFLMSVSSNGSTGEKPNTDGDCPSIELG
jgi:hypothetical protein